MCICMLHVCVCYMCICMPVMNHASAYRVRIPGLCHLSKILVYISSRCALVLLNISTSWAPSRNYPPTRAPPFPLPPHRFLGMTQEQQEGVGDVKTSKLIKIYWGSPERAQLPAEGTQPEGTLKAQFRALWCFPVKADVFSVTTSGKNSPGLLLPFSVLKQKEAGNRFS